MEIKKKKKKKPSKRKAVAARKEAYKKSRKGKASGAGSNKSSTADIYKKSHKKKTVKEREDSPVSGKPSTIDPYAQSLKKKVVTEIDDSSVGGRSSAIDPYARSRKKKTASEIDYSPDRKAHGEDPYITRERKKYAKPVPSREFIIEYLEKVAIPVKRRQISKDLGVSEDTNSKEAFRRRLVAMVRDGQIIKNRNRQYILVNDKDLIKGAIQGHHDGFGYVFPDDSSEKIFMPPREMRSLLHGDTVIVRIAGLDRHGIREGSLVEIIERKNIDVVGRFFSESGVGFVVPENKRIHQDIFIPAGKCKKTVSGQIVVVKIIEQPAKHMQPIGEITEVIGDHMAPGMEIDIASRVYGIPVVWPSEVDAETDKFKTTVLTSAKKERVDLRELPLVTIDGEDARDFDDAVYCKPTENGWKLIVAIADVSHYVKMGSALDVEARSRGTSVYFPNSVIPMLPEKLSNGLCSLKPKVDRLCMVCEMEVTKKGVVRKSDFYKAVMRSSARLTYTEVAAVLVEKCSKIRKKHDKLIQDLENLWDVYKALRKERKRRGAIDFDTVETQIVFTQDKKIEKIIPIERNEAHLLIEECMVSANVCAANFLEKHKIHGLFRDHEPPKDKKLELLYQFLGQLGLHLGKGSDTPQPKDYHELITRIKDRPDFHLIQTVLLRSLSQAEYRPDNIGHFGLSLESYAHFTSPIRRYPDLLVHRAIEFTLQGGKVADYYYCLKEMEDLGKNCSMAERRADDATRDVDLSLKCQYMEDKVGERFEGTISGVTSFGVFVEINNIYVEGLIHVTELGKDYFHFDPISRQMKGERTGKRFRLGDQLKIIVVKVDVEGKKIDFALV